MTTGVATADQATRAPQIGSFTIIERLTVTSGPKGQVLLRVQGAEGTPFSGQSGVATCYSAPKDEAARASAKATLDKLAALRHPALVPVLQSGIAGNVLFWVRADVSSQRLEMPSPASLIPTSTVVAIVNAVASGLSTAHDAGLSHGSLTHRSIITPTPGAYAVDGIGAVGRDPAKDQRDLGAIVVGLLSGREWLEDPQAGPVSIEERLARAQRLREWMSGTTERVVNVVLRATEINPADRFGSINEFAEQFGFAVRESAEDLVHGAFEAISSRNVELARLLAAKAALYNPSADSLTLLNLQLGGGSPFGAMPVAAPTPPGLPVEALAPPALTLPPMTAPGEAENVLSPELAQGLPPEFLQMIAPQFEVTKPKKGMNPIFVLVIGGVCVILLLLVAALATLILSGS